MSGIVLPMAPAGTPRAASPQVVEQGAGGAAVAAFGARLAEIGEGLETDRLDREMARARIDMTKGLGEARLELEEVGDPEALDAGWAERSASLRERFVTGADPRNAPRLELAFDELSTKHALALGARALDLRQGARRAAVDDMAYTVVGSAARLDPDTRAAQFDAFTDTVTEQIAAGVLSPEAGADILRRTRADMDQAAALRAFEADPAALVAALDDGEYDGLDPVYRERLRGQASGAVRTAEAAAAKEAERAANEAASAIDGRLEVMIGNARDGRVNTWEADFLADPAVQDRPKFAEAQAAVALRDALPEFATLPPAEQAAMIAAEKGKPVTERYETRLLEAMETTHAAAAKAWADDPIAQASALGLAPAPPLPDLSSASPAEMAEALAARRGYGRSLATAGYVGAPSYFSAEERAALAAATGVEADPARRTALAGALAAAFGADAPAALREIGGDPVFRQVGGLAASGGRAGIAAEAFRGQQMLDQKIVAEFAPEPRQTVLDEVLGDLVDDPYASGAIMDTARALYAARSRGLAGDDDAASRRYAQAVQDAIGAGTDAEGAQTGGVQPVRGVPTVLPIGVRGDAVEAALLRAGSLAYRGNRDPWLAASASGGAPVFAGEPLSPRIMGEASLRAIGNGIYALSIERRGRTYDVIDEETGEPYAMRLERFMAEVGR